MIIPLIIIGIIIIIWIQYPDIRDSQEDPVYKKIFNRIKIPLLLICILAIFYFTLLHNKNNNNNYDINNLKVYMSNPTI